MILTRYLFITVWFACYHCRSNNRLGARFEIETVTDAKAAPDKDFARYRTVRPVVHHSLTKREIRTTRSTNGAHHSDVTVTVHIDGKDYVLDLTLNRGLITDDHIIRYQAGGKTVLHKPQKEEIDLCQYSGKVRGNSNSWVALSTCRGLKGVIFDGQIMRYIQPVEGNDILSPHYLFEHSERNENHPYKCGYDGGVTSDTNYDLLLETYQRRKAMERSRANRYKRESGDTPVRGPYSENTMSRYVELVLVADYEEYKVNNADLKSVHHNMKDVANIVNAIYSPLNIFVALVGVVVWTEKDEIVIDSNGDSTLQNFLNYRKKVLLREIPNDNAQLITRQNLADGVLGKALKGTICTYEFSGAINRNNSGVIGSVAATVAHMMGHNFGMEHDTQDCECSDDHCIMELTSSAAPAMHWSKCSMRALELAFSRGMDYCLRNIPKRLFEHPTCGNGFVEPGEQCDCGIPLVSSATNTCHHCCQPKTCTLRANATCGSGRCCDLLTCRHLPAKTMCRGAASECDLPEYCTGRSEYCPTDVHKMDTTPCARGDAYCFKGRCGSRDSQCRLLWGSTGASSLDICYVLNNIKGSTSGNCGYDLATQKYFACAKRDALCGRLHCQHFSNQLEFGQESVARLSATFIYKNRTIIPCRTATVDLGLNDIDPGLVPDGAKCGDDRMCLNRKCMELSEIRETINRKNASVCPTDCSGHGVCNSEGHCHCEPGFTPPMCV